MGFSSAALSIPSSSSSSSLLFFHRTPLTITSSSSTRNNRPNNTRKPSLKKAAASSSSSSSSSRPKSHNNNNNPDSLRARNLSYADDGGEATTYTRLPPKDEDTSFLLDPSLSAVITLHDSVSPNFKTTTSSSKTTTVTIGEEEEQLLLSFDSDDEDEYEEDDDAGFESSLNKEEDDGLAVISGSNSNVFTGKTKELAGAELGLGSGLGDEEDSDSEQVKEKGIPAVMRCFDRAKIYVKAGDGGNGVVAFRREKFVPYGGPSGGDGGKGGDVYVEVDGSMNSLLPFRKNIHFRAGRGSHGQGRKQAGAKGEDVVVKVAPGTLVREAVKGETAEGEVLLELVSPGDRALLLPGGRGGKGNASFKSGTNKVPKIAENGEEGAEMWLDLELKLVADVGIVGAPNAGKSTLLSAISAAKPSIANYPFTTLLPNLGVVYLDFDATMVVADLPGLLEGAHQGFGLGHEFLRHTERCSVLVHVVDGSSLQPEYEFDAVRLELELFSPGLAEKPYIVAYNKMDLPEASEKWFSFKGYLETHGIHTFCMSAMNHQGTHDVVCAAYELLQKEAEEKKDIQEWTNPRNLNYVAESIQKQRSASMNDFKIVHDGTCNTWHVVGAGVERFVQMTNWKYTESLRRFQHALEACGVNKSLVKCGVQEGDTVIVGEMEMVWHNATQQSGTSSTRNHSDGSVKWPQFN